MEAAQKTLEGEVGKDQVDTNIQHLVNQKTQELNVRTEKALHSIHATCAVDYNVQYTYVHTYIRICTRKAK